MTLLKSPLFDIEIITPTLYTIDYTRFNSYVGIGLNPKINNKMNYLKTRLIILISGIYVKLFADN